jgi:hypothetical protein
MSPPHFKTQTLTARIQLVPNQYFTELRNSSSTRHTIIYTRRVQRYSIGHRKKSLSDGFGLVDTRSNLRAVSAYICSTGNMEHMNNTINSHIESHKGLNESRFKTILSLFRLGGISLNKKSVSAANTFYNATLIVCFYITTLCLYMDSYVSRIHLVQAMKKIRILVAMQLITWTHFSLRYTISYSEFLRK